MLKYSSFIFADLGGIFEIGGSDQLGHLDAGYDYIRRRTKRLSAGICLPLITDSSGNKLGKSVTDCKESVWLSENKTSPYAFYQFFRQQPDNQIVPLMRYFSLKSLDDMNAILSEHESNLGKWIAQEELAKELTQLVHGADGLRLAQQCSNALFKGYAILVLFFFWFVFIINDHNVLFAILVFVYNLEVTIRAGSLKLCM
ncbi:unnamed protein product [Anisakis simplex]|uniref:tyrosine--tRNA ligase n=1 Tax=Anisakis simplex TaxID=6269 RepID=A0A0M3JDF2_ANISI|nr:unnamed protein product [Anisakis simplex]